MSIGTGKGHVCIEASGVVWWCNGVWIPLALGEESQQHCAHYRDTRVQHKSWSPSLWHLVVRLQRNWSHLEQGYLYFADNYVTIPYVSKLWSRWSTSGWSDRLWGEPKRSDISPDVKGHSGWQARWRVIARRRNSVLYRRQPGAPQWNFPVPWFSKKRIRRGANFCRSPCEMGMCWSGSWQSVEECQDIMEKKAS